MESPSYGSAKVNTTVAPKMPGLVDRLQDLRSYTRDALTIASEVRERLGCPRPPKEDDISDRVPSANGIVGDVDEQVRELLSDLRSIQEFLG